MRTRASMEVWWLLADQLPHATNFYLRYAVLLWGTPFVDLLRCRMLSCSAQRKDRSHVAVAESNMHFLKDV